MVRFVGNITNLPSLMQSRAPDSCIVQAAVWVQMFLETESETRRTACGNMQNPGSEVGRGLRRDAWTDPRLAPTPIQRSAGSQVRFAPGLNRHFPRGRPPRRARAWPSIAAGEHVLLVSPTGTGKTLAAFLAILDRLFRSHKGGTLRPGLRCVYISPLRSLNYDIERNLSRPLDGIRERMGYEESPVKVGVRTGDTSAHYRRKLRDRPPHVLITTPESLSLLLSHSGWHAHWRCVEHIIIDEVHALAPTKRGADLAVSLERLAAHAERDPIRVGLSATCQEGDAAAGFWSGRPGPAASFRPDRLWERRRRRSRYKV